MKEITKFEPLPYGMAAEIMKAGWPVLSGKIDEPFGAGTIDKQTKAVWTTDGKRIEVSMGGGSFIVSQSREADPIYAERKNQK